MTLIPVLQQVGDDDGDLRGFFVIADRSEEIRERQRREGGEPLALFLFPFGRRMDEVESQLIQQNQHALSREESRPLLFRWRGISREISTELLPD